MPMWIYDSATARKAIQKLWIYDSASARKAIQKMWIYDSAGNRKLIFSGASQVDFVMTAGVSGAITGFRYFNYGSTVPDLPRVRDNGAVIVIESNGSQIKLGISGIGGAMVTATNVFTAFQSALIGELLPGAAVFTPSGSAGNSGGEWLWGTGSKFINGGNYNQYLKLV